jgi:gamma-glutamylcyclotransferase (GGCT)/AIG2-like uncharacterized protein YtfP
VSHSARQTIRHLFTYGTLRPGHSRWSQLAGFADPFQPPRPATVRGELWLTPYGWPALTCGTDKVTGMLVTLTEESLAAALSLLDVIEGVNQGLFRRDLTLCLPHSRCWVYRWPGATDGFVRAPITALLH